MCAFLISATWNLAESKLSLTQVKFSTIICWIVLFFPFFFSFQNSYYLHFVFPWPIFQIFTLMISIYVCFVLYFEIILALTVNDLPLNSFKILFQNKVKFCFKNNVTKLLDMCVHYTWISLNAVVYFHLCFHLL